MSLIRPTLTLAPSENGPKYAKLRPYVLRIGSQHIRLTLEEVQALRSDTELAINETVRLQLETIEKHRCLHRDPESPNGD